MGLEFSTRIKDPYFCIYGKSSILAIKINRSWYVNIRNWNIDNKKLLEDLDLGSITPSGYALKQFKLSLREDRKYYNSLWPQLTPQINRVIKTGYNSGTLYSRPGFYPHKVWHYDLNGAYGAAFRDAEVPIGVPNIVKGYLPPDGKHLNVYCMDLNVEYNTNEVFPYLVNSGNKNKTSSQVVSSTGLHSMYKVITEVEFTDLQKDYDVEYDCVYTFQFKKATGLFDRWVKQFHELKDGSTGDMRTIYKSILASLAGKFAQGIEQQNVPISVNEFGNIKYQTIKIPEGDVTYINPAVSLFIVDHVRKLMRDVTRKVGYKNVLLVDTDGFVTSRKLNVSLSRDLGGWKCNEYENLIVNGTRSYFYTENGEFHSSISGLGDIHDDDLNHYNYDALYNLYKLKPIAPVTKKVMYCGKEKFISMNVHLGGK